MWEVNLNSNTHGLILNRTQNLSAGIQTPAIATQTILPHSSPERVFPSFDRRSYVVSSRLCLVGVTADGQHAAPWQRSVESSISPIFQFSEKKKREKMAADWQRGARSSESSDVSRPSTSGVRSHPSLRDWESCEETQRKLWGNYTSGRRGRNARIQAEEWECSNATTSTSGTTNGLNSQWRLLHVINHGWNDRSGCPGLPSIDVANAKFYSLVNSCYVMNWKNMKRSGEKGKLLTFLVDSVASDVTAIWGNLKPVFSQQFTLEAVEWKNNRDVGFGFSRRFKCLGSYSDYATSLVLWSMNGGHLFLRLLWV